MAWRVARSLEMLREQINHARPKRNKSADGTIGDAAHASRTSDHNPWVKDGSSGVVTAMDITHDPKGGVDAHKMAEHLRVTKDARIKYCISNKRIFSSQTAPWQWRPYSGKNPHSAHVHVSVLPGKAHYDSVALWDLGALLDEAVGSESTPPAAPASPTLRRGAEGQAVETLQRLLGVQVDGKFGPRTETAVREYQQQHVDLANDGIVGFYTWAKLQEKKQ